MVINCDTADDREIELCQFRLWETWEDTICRSDIHHIMFTWLKFGFFTKVGSSFLLWHFLAEPPEVFCVMGWVGGGRSSHPLALLYEGSVRGQVVLAGREGGWRARGEGRLGWVGGEPSCCLVLLRFQPEKSQLKQSRSDTLLSLYRNPQFQKFT